MTGHNDTAAAATTASSSQPQNKPLRIKTKLVVAKKKRKTTSTLQATQRARGALPTFRPRTSLVTSSAKPKSSLQAYPQTSQSEIQEDSTNNNNTNPDDLLPQDSLWNAEELPSDTFLALQSMLNESRGLPIPLLHHESSVQVVLPLQVYQRFAPSHASTVCRELLELTQQNRIRQIPCQGRQNTGSSFVYIRTEDYVAGVWDAHHQGHERSDPVCEPFVECFVSSLSRWTQSTLTRGNLEAWWKDRKDPSPVGTRGIIEYLLQIQVLLRDTTNHSAGGSRDDECYSLWLPQWGLVLKSWNDARRNMLAFIARSYRGEVSKANLLRENRNSSISTQFLLDEMQKSGEVIIVQRPFGEFVQRPKESS